MKFKDQKNCRKEVFIVDPVTMPCKMRLFFTCLCLDNLEKQYIYKKRAIKSKIKEQFCQPELKKLDIFAKLELEKIK